MHIPPSQEFDAPSPHGQQHCGDNPAIAAHGAVDPYFQSISLAGPLPSFTHQPLVSIPHYPFSQAHGPFTIVQSGLFGPVPPLPLVPVATYDALNTQLSLSPISSPKTVKPRSSLLDQYNGNGNREWRLSDIQDHVAEFSCDRNASRFVQQAVENTVNPSEDLGGICAELISTNALIDVCRDSFGNYVVQKLLEHGSGQQRQMLSMPILQELVLLSLDNHGCRVIQKLLELVPHDVQEKIVMGLDYNILFVAKHVHGNHVVQKLLEVVPCIYLHPIVLALQGQVFEFSRDIYGCRVIQRCLQYLPSDMIHSLVVNEIIPYAIELSMDEFGHYIIQYLLEYGSREEKAGIFGRLHGQFDAMARHKYASNVCEKALIYSDTPARYLIIEELISGNGFPSNVWLLMNHPYGNYVLQQALAAAEGPQRSVLHLMVKHELAHCPRDRKSHLYGKQLASIRRSVNGQRL